jgi:hypothetical protein
MISVVIPAIDYHEITEKAMKYMRDKSLYNLEYIVIDNASEVPYVENEKYRVIRNEENLGGPKTIQQALNVATYDIVMVVHNDVLVHEYAWDVKIVQAFERDPKLAIAGFFGAKGIGEHGGRIVSMSNMQGKETGTNWRGHSEHITGVEAATVLDGLCMIFRKSAWQQIRVPELAIHHFYDKIYPLCAIQVGFHCAVIGVAFDHGMPEGMHSTANASKIYHASAEKWAQEHNIELVDNNADLTMYKVNEHIMFQLFSAHFPIFVRDVSTDDEVKYDYIAQATM